jgi:hypothetical protein
MFGEGFMRYLLVFEKTLKKKVFEMFLYFDNDEDHALNKKELEGWAKELMKPQVRKFKIGETADTNQMLLFGPKTR